MGSVAGAADCHTDTFGGGLEAWKAGCTAIGLAEIVSIDTSVVGDYGNIVALE
jgi:hypothetical protein